MSRARASQDRLAQTMQFGYQILAANGRYVYDGGIEVSNFPIQHKGVPVADENHGTPVYFFETPASELNKLVSLHMRFMGIAATDETVEFTYEPMTYESIPPEDCDPDEEVQWLEQSRLNILVNSASGKWPDAEYTISYDPERKIYLSDYYVSHGKLPDLGSELPFDNEMCVAVDGLLLAVSLLNSSPDAVV